MSFLETKVDVSRPFRMRLPRRRVVRPGARFHLSHYLTLHQSPCYHDTELFTQLACIIRVTK